MYLSVFFLCSAFTGLYSPDVVDFLSPSLRDADCLTDCPAVLGFFFYLLPLLLFFVGIFCFSVPGLALSPSDRSRCLRRRPPHHARAAPSRFITRGGSRGGVRCRRLRGPPMHCCLRRRSVQVTATLERALGPQVGERESRHNSEKHVPRGFVTPSPPPSPRLQLLFWLCSVGAVLVVSRPAERGGSERGVGRPRLVHDAPYSFSLCFFFFLSSGPRIETPFVSLSSPLSTSPPHPDVDAVIIPGSREEASRRDRRQLR